MKKSTKFAIVREISNARWTTIDYYVWGLALIVVGIVIGGIYFTGDDEEVRAAESIDEKVDIVDAKYAKQEKELDELDAQYEVLEQKVLINQTADTIVEYVTSPFEVEVQADEPLEENENENQEPVPR